MFGVSNTQTTDVTWNAHGVTVLTECQVYLFYMLNKHSIVTWRVSYKRQELLTSHEHMGSPSVFGGVRVALF